MSSWRGRIRLHFLGIAWPGPGTMAPGGKPKVADDLKNLGFLRFAPRGWRLRLPALDNLGPQVIWNRGDKRGTDIIF